MFPLYRDIYWNIDDSSEIYNRPENLITLCRTCHGRQHRSNKQEYDWEYYYFETYTNFRKLIPTAAPPRKMLSSFILKGLRQADI